MGAFDDPRYRKIDIPRSNATQDVLTWGNLHSADFSEKTIAFKITGDMPHLAAGRYAILEADKLRMIVMQANLWREQQAPARVA